MYVCIYVCMYVFMYVCTYVSKYVCMCVCTYVCIRVCNSCDILVVRNMCNVSVWVVTMYTAVRI